MCVAKRQSEHATHAHKPKTKQKTKTKKRKKNKAQKTESVDAEQNGAAKPTTAATAAVTGAGGLGMRVVDDQFG